MRTDLRTEMRWGATLGDGRFRSPESIAHHSTYGLHSVRTMLRQMERRGEVEVRRGIGNTHGSKKVYRAR